MIYAVLDTNIIVSALLREKSNPAEVVGLLSQLELSIYYSQEIFAEYVAVLHRPKFSFSAQDIADVLRLIVRFGSCITASPASEKCFHEDDQKFYDVAKTAGAYLITGNAKHFPADACVISPTDFLTNVDIINSITP
ncbi:MAG: putative toxin-antitoxin system toxin component, PIN family [Oscillospiraceae bacterium]|jgi:putative PIN family toxin of toxin-antitoxin system|nr:putative toxin-antitoxin system toxin component, PIN family [Oscillospiraceae bacterium]